MASNGNVFESSWYMRGMEQLMMDFVLNPELAHEIMRRVTDFYVEHFAKVLAAARGRIDLVFTADDIAGQEGLLLSPAMWEEFLLDYQRPVLERFALVSYGCCENLTHKIGGVLSIPNLRIFVSSAWTDLAKVVDAVGDRYTIMWRQKAGDVVFPDDLSGQRRHLREGLRIAKGCYVQIVLRELQTLRGRMRRLHEWARIAKEEAAAHC